MLHKRSKLLFFLICLAFIGKFFYKEKGDKKKPILLVRYVCMWDKSVARSNIILTSLQKYFQIVENKESYHLVIRGGFGDPPKDLDKSAALIYWIMEPQTSYIQEADLSIGFEYGDSETHIRFPHYYEYSWSKNIRNTYIRKRVRRRRKFAGFLVSNVEYYKGDRFFDGVSARNEFFKILSKYKRIDSGGRVFNNTGYIVSFSQTINWLSGYKFIIAFENKTFPGYMTEKLFQAYYAGAIPIWYGDRKALKDINPKAIIYSGDFKSLNELGDYVKRVDEDPELYEKIWREPLIIDEERSYERQVDRLSKKILQMLERKGIIKITPHGIIVVKNPANKGK